MINQYEQVQNHTKTSEISIENSKRVVLSDNNSSSSSTVIEKSQEKVTESNGTIQNCERFSGSECVVENSMKADDKLAIRPKSSSSCSDLLIFCQSQPKPKHPEIEQQTTSVADFTIPYNIINNYFSGSLRIQSALSRFCLRDKILLFFPINSWCRCGDLRQVSLGAREKPTQVQFKDEEQALVL